MEEKKKRKERKMQSERIFNLEDANGGDIISMEDIRRSSEDKKRRRLLEEQMQQ